jgi:hypothetical protein
MLYQDLPKLIRRSLTDSQQSDGPCNEIGGRIELNYRRHCIRTISFFVWLRQQRLMPSLSKPREQTETGNSSVQTAAVYSTLTYSQPYHFPDLSFVASVRLRL